MFGEKRAGWLKPETDQRLSGHISISVLTRGFPSDLVDRVIDESGRTDEAGFELVAFRISWRHAHLRSRRHLKHDAYILVALRGWMVVEVRPSVTEGEVERRRMVRASRVPVLAGGVGEIVPMARPDRTVQLDRGEAES